MWFLKAGASVLAAWLVVLQAPCCTQSRLLLKAVDLQKQRHLRKNTTAHLRLRNAPEEGETAEGGQVDVTGVTDSSVWRPEDANGPIFSFFFAGLFVALIGSAPIILAKYTKHGFTNLALAESAVLYVWLVGGLYLFTHVLWFQSVHFNGEIRHLTLEEAVYLFSQIITTVGYGDITPAKTRGQIFVGIFVFISIMLIANMVSEITTLFAEKMDDIGEAYGVDIMEDEDDPAPPAGEAPSFRSVAVCGAGWFFCVFVGTCFFHLYPGEDKTIFQGIYMSMITLSTVGFGAFTPVTHGGMVFGAYWMIFGSAALVSTVSSFTAWSMKLKQWELEQSTKDVNA